MIFEILNKFKTGPDEYTFNKYAWLFFIEMLIREVTGYRCIISEFPEGDEVGWKIILKDKDW